MIKYTYAFILFVSIICCKKSNTEQASKDNTTHGKNYNIQQKTINRYIDNPDYFIKDIDINNDRFIDKVVSNEKYKGNALLFFLNKNDNYELVLESINFSEDGGKIIGEIEATNNGNEVVKIHTYFPDGGIDKATYFISYAENSWMLNRTIFETSNWQEDHTKNYLCEVQQNIHLSKLNTQEGIKLLKQIPKVDVRANKCEIKYKFEGTLEQFSTRFKEGSKKSVTDVDRYKALLSKFNLSKENLILYNDIAYYLEKLNAYKESIFLLEKIINQFPNRTVAYINLGDAYWGVGEEQKAKETYNKYIVLMKSSGKEQKIPKLVWDRINL